MYETYMTYNWFPEHWNKLEPIIENLGVDWETTEGDDGTIMATIFELSLEEGNMLANIENEMRNQNIEIYRRE